MTTVIDLLKNAKTLYMFNSGTPVYHLSSKSGHQYTSNVLSDLLPFQIEAVWKNIKIARLYHSEDPTIQVIRNDTSAKNYYLTVEEFLVLDRK